MATAASSESIDRDIARLRAEHYNASVVAVREAHAGLRIFRVAPDWGRLDFQPGQYAQLGLGAWETCVGGDDGAAAEDLPIIRRAYSFSASMLDDKGELQDPRNVHYREFYVALAPDSGLQRPRLTPRLFRLRAGDRLYVGPHAHGRYTLSGVGHDEQIVFVATGTGEAPHNAMLAARLAAGSRQPIVSVACVRRSLDLAYLAVHRELQRRFANYRYLTLTTREPENLDPRAPGFVGKRHLQEYFASGDFERAAGLRLDPARTHIYLCGNPAMVGLPGRGAELQPQGMAALLVGQGFTLDAPGRPGNLHCERYW